jgi:hypothetical protein
MDQRAPAAPQQVDGRQVAVAILLIPYAGESGTVYRVAVQGGPIPVSITDEFRRMFLSIQHICNPAFRVKAVT